MQIPEMNKFELIRFSSPRKEGRNKEEKALIACKNETSWQEVRWKIWLGLVLWRKKFSFFSLPPRKKLRERLGGKNEGKAKEFWIIQSEVVFVPVIVRKARAGWANGNEPLLLIPPSHNQQLFFIFHSQFFSLSPEFFHLFWNGKYVVCLPVKVIGCL